MLGRFAPGIRRVDGPGQVTGDVRQNKMNQNNLLPFGLSVIAGILIWLFFLVGLKTEPWDTPYGILAILVLGFLFGLYAPQKPWLWPVGLYIGQFLFGALIFLKSIFFYSGGGANLFLPLGMIFLIFFCIPALVASLLGSAIRRIIFKIKEEP